MSARPSHCACAWMPAMLTPAHAPASDDRYWQTAAEKKGQNPIQVGPSRVGSCS